MMKKVAIRASLLLFAVTALLGCAQNETAQTEPSSVEPIAESTTETAQTTTADGETGTLEIVANGEDFVRQGFVSKDGWEITFNHVYVNLADITAYQTDPPYNAEADGELNAKQQVKISDVKTVDLAAGDETAEPIQVAQLQAPAGQYNALSWKMVKATEGPATGYPLIVAGTAEKAGETVNFTVKFDEELAFSCGEFVGEERKGIVQPGGTGELEATFHFDHIFGDGSAPPDDEINTGALGFEPIAALANNGEVNVDTAQLQESLSPEDYRQMKEILPSLGHVGEGHCREQAMVDG